MRSVPQRRGKYEQTALAKTLSAGGAVKSGAASFTSVVPRKGPIYWSYTIRCQDFRGGHGSYGLGSRERTR